MTPLYQEMHRWLGMPFIWGESDCMIVLGDWIERIHGIDPVADLRYTYDSPGTCQRMTGFFTDPVSTVAEFAEVKAGLVRRDGLACKGDVGVLRIGGGRMDVAGGLFTGKSWAVKAPNGATTLKPLEVLAVWDSRYEQG